MCVDLESLECSHLRFSDLDCEHRVVRLREGNGALSCLPPKSLEEGISDIATVRLP